MKHTILKNDVPFGPTRHKTEARVVYDALIASEGLDWRVGFYMKTREGNIYRLVDKEGNEVKK